MTYWIYHYKDLFDGMLGTFHTKSVYLERKDDAISKHRKTFSVAKIHKELWKRIWTSFVILEYWKRVAIWHGQNLLSLFSKRIVWFISNYRYLSKYMVRKPCHIPKTVNMLQKIKGLEWAILLDQNTGYYTIHLDPHSQKICTIILPWGKYQYFRLLMGVNVSPDVFQEKCLTSCRT